MMLFFKDDKNVLRQIESDTYNDAMYYISNHQEISKDSGIKMSTIALGLVIGSNK